MIKYIKYKYSRNKKQKNNRYFYGKNKFDINKINKRNEPRRNNKIILYLIFYIIKVLIKNQ